MSDAAVNPAHHKGFVGDLQWAEAYVARLLSQGDSSYSTAAMLVASWGDKYFDRMGRKDEVVQEVKKGMWYLRYAYVLNQGQSIVPSIGVWESEVESLVSRQSDVDKIVHLMGRPTSRLSVANTHGALGAAMFLLRERRSRDYAIELLTAAAGLSLMVAPDKHLDATELSRVLLSF